MRKLGWDVGASLESASLDVYHLSYQAPSALLQMSIRREATGGDMLTPNAFIKVTMCKA